MVSMYTPPHPGKLIRGCLEARGLDVTQAAKLLGVSRAALSNLLNGKASISTAMAFKLATLFKITAQSWINQQMQYNLWKAAKRFKRKSNDRD